MESLVYLAHVAGYFLWDTLSHVPWLIQGAAYPHCHTQAAMSAGIKSVSHLPQWEYKYSKHEAVHITTTSVFELHVLNLPTFIRTRLIT